MVFLEAAFVFGLLGVVTYVILRSLLPPAQSRPATRSGRWVVVHYDADGSTRVAVEKVSTGGVTVLDEHVVATIAIDDADYDAKFLAAMAAARERQALFEAEDG